MEEGAEVGQFWTPIQAKSGSLLHADSQKIIKPREWCAWIGRDVTPCQGVGAMPQGKIPTPEVGGSMGISSQGWHPVHWLSVNPLDLEQLIEAVKTATGRHWLASESEALY
jgi:hypothetical protein